MRPQRLQRHPDRFSQQHPPLHPGNTPPYSTACRDISFALELPLPAGFLMHPRNAMPRKSHPWGTPPWSVDFRPAPRGLPDHVDFAIVGGGFTGLSAAAWLSRLAPRRSVLVLESDSLGEGAS